MDVLSVIRVQTTLPKTLKMPLNSREERMEERIFEVWIQKLLPIKL